MPEAITTAVVRQAFAAINYVKPGH